MLVTTEDHPMLRAESEWLRLCGCFSCLPPKKNSSGTSRSGVAVRIKYCECQNDMFTDLIVVVGGRDVNDMWEVD